MKRVLSVYPLRSRFIQWMLLVLFCLALCGPILAQGVQVTDYASIQAALDANPGRMVFLPAGDHVITKKIVINKDGGGLYGPGRIVQQTADQPIVVLENAANAQLRDLTLTRAEGQTESSQEGVLVMNCEDATLENIRVVDNRSPAGSITLRECRGAQVRGCRVENYMRISVDDRTHSENYGYAFRCIDGSGIVVNSCVGTTVQNCRVVERKLRPTQAVKQEFQLGSFTKKNAQKGVLVSQQVWDAAYVNNWHQGSGIVVTGPRKSSSTQILGNQVLNAAQGIDLHCDQVIVAHNVVNNAFIGMKAMHGSRNVLITGNQFIKNDLWSIGLMPGAASGASRAAEGNKPAEEPNTDGGSMIVNNIISDFGYGDSAWIWGASSSCNPLRFDRGQEAHDPPLQDVLIQGNIIYDSGRDLPLVDGAPKFEAPRYQYAVRIETGGTNAPRGLHFSGNIFNPGTQGVSNVELPP
jgi:nitrous oxidase accessory protein NosD